jgi:hypothetical protein
MKQMNEIVMAILVKKLIFIKIQKQNSKLTVSILFSPGQDTSTGTIIRD